MLRPLQETFDPQDYPDLRVGLAAPDDAAVWRVDDDRLLVMSTDFFTPVVDDPYDYGATAAANSLSDIYAMGAVPFMALNIACLPVDLPPEMVREIFRGLSDVAQRAGTVIAGGHTIQDQEPKVGLVALGFAAPDELITKDGLEPGDQLVLTKPIGTGVTSTAIKADKAAREHEAEVTAWMKRLNDAASVLARRHAVRAGTDITGFGLLGHALEMARPSRVGLSIWAEAVPLLRGALDYADRGFVPGGSADNRSHFSSDVYFVDRVEEALRTVLFDAQTSGGLLLAVPKSSLATFLQAAGEAETPAWVIGEVVDGQGVSVDAAGAPESALGADPSVVYWSS